MAIERAHTLICAIGADTLHDLCGELREMARKLERGEITTGVMGGPSVGTTYSYKVRPEQTHDKYFQDIEDWLAADIARDCDRKITASLTAMGWSSPERMEQLEAALRSVVNHWREFGGTIVYNNAVNKDDYGFDERIDGAAKLVGL